MASEEAKGNGGVENQNILFKIHRSKNENEVVYEGMFTHARALPKGRRGLASVLVRGCW